MKLKVLGSGNIFSNCNSASYLIDENILIDVPNGTCKILKNIGIDINKIEHIIITHFHGDHFFDMPFLLLNKMKENSNMSYIYCDDTGEAKIYNTTKLAFPSKIEKIKEYFQYIYQEKFKVGKYEVKKVHLEHEEGICSYGYIFKHTNETVGFTGDTNFNKNVEEMAKICNHLICDCNSIEGKKSHMGIDNIKELASKYPQCTFYTTHMDNLTREKLQELNITNIIILKDNDEFIL